MISEVDEALEALIRRDALAEHRAEVVFDAPTKEWASRRNAPTVDVYLYDVREDVRRRERGYLGQREQSADGPGRVVARTPPARRFKLSYLITAWTQRPEEEHRLLSSLLGCFLRHEWLPLDVLPEPLAALGEPLHVTIALPPPEDRSFADVWSALGGELKPSLDIIVNLPVDTGQVRAAGPPVGDDGLTLVTSGRSDGRADPPRRRHVPPPPGERPAADPEHPPRRGGMRRGPRKP